MGFRYTPEQWQLIAANVRDPDADLEELRLTLEYAATNYAESSQRKGSEKARAEAWAQIHDAALTLKQLLEGLGDELDYRLEYLKQSLTALMLEASVSESTLNASLERTLKKDQAELGKVRASDADRLRYYGCVLETWVSHGGALSVSVAPNTGIPHGPLVRYFSAVTAPAMGESRPSLHSIRDIVKNYKKIRETNKPTFNESLIPG